MQEHKLAHGAKPFYCEFAGYTTSFTTERAQKNHVKKIHAQDKKSSHVNTDVERNLERRGIERKDHHKRCEDNANRKP